MKNEFPSSALFKAVARNATIVVSLSALLVEADSFVNFTALTVVGIVSITLIHTVQQTKQVV